MITGQISSDGSTARGKRPHLPLFGGLIFGPQLYFRLIAFSIAIFVFLGTAGCQYFYDSTGQEKMIPVPLAEIFPCEVKGQLYRVWVGNEIQIQSGEFTSYLLLQGVNNPDSDDELEQQAIDHLNASIDGQEIRAVVYERDSMQRSIAQVFVGETNLNLQLIRAGWGRYDGTTFATSESFSAAQAQAQQYKLGIWNKN